MRDYSLQREEIETIKPRTITVNLSDADVGIAEGHAVTFAAGLAAGGMRPIFAVYSSFLQRAYDQVLHDVCIQNLPVVFAIDRAGLVGSDGETHQGIFDLSYLSSIPNIILSTVDLASNGFRKEFII